MSPLPPSSTLSTIPPQNFWRPLTRYAWRLNENVNGTPTRSASHCTASRERSTTACTSPGSDRPSPRRIMSSANCSAVYGSMSIVAAASDGAFCTSGSRSASPPCTVRCAPAVKKPFPPTHSLGPFSTMSTRVQPNSTAECAAQLPALPEPTTMQSKVFSDISEVARGAGGVDEQCLNDAERSSCSSFMLTSS